MSTFPIRVFGDPVLKQRAREIADIDGSLARLVSSMIDTMYDAPGTGLAAPQIGVQKRLFVYDVGEGPVTVINPELIEQSGEWTYDEGCLSIPGLSFDIVRPKVNTVKALNLAGEEVIIEGDELLGRVLLHELDHLDGILLFDRLAPDDRKQAMRMLREQQLTGTTARTSHSL